jgi:ABC-2 type transport system ATP-binding protein
MKILTGSMAPTEGIVEIAGVDIFENPIEAKDQIGYLPEKPPLYFDMKVEPYLFFVAKLRGVEKSNLENYVMEALEAMDLVEVRDRVIGNLSKGFRQRVGIAQAIVSKPRILVFDEPTVGLDPSQVAHFRNLLKSLKGKHTIILSTHILPEVQASCERVVIINEGRIVTEDSLQALAQKTSKGVRRVTLKVLRPKEDFKRVLADLDFVKMHSFSGQNLHIDMSGGDETLEDLSSRVVASGMGLLGMEVSSDRLEDIFLELTSKK